MVGVQLKATSTQSKRMNGDALQDNIGKIVGPWKGGKLTSLTLRPFSLNTYCLSKVLFNCGSLDLRVGDIKKINSDIKSWLFADQLEQPEEMILHRPRASGGLGLYSVKYKSMAELIRSFLEISINTNFQTNQYHNALFQYHVENKRSIPPPPYCPYLA